MMDEKFMRIMGCIFGGTMLGAAFGGYLGAIAGLTFAAMFSLLFIVEK
jgi:hypothetical protein